MWHAFVVGPNVFTAMLFFINVFIDVRLQYNIVLCMHISNHNATKLLHRGFLSVYSFIRGAQQLSVILLMKS